MVSVRYGASGAPKNVGPQSNSLARPAEWPGARCVFLGFPTPTLALPIPQTGPC